MSPQQSPQAADAAAVEQHASAAVVQGDTALSSTMQAVLDTLGETLDASHAQADAKLKDAAAAVRSMARQGDAALQSQMEGVASHLMAAIDSGQQVSENQLTQIVGQLANAGIGVSMPYSGPAPVAKVATSGGQQVTTIPLEQQQQPQQSLIITQPRPDQTPANGSCAAVVELFLQVGWFNAGDGFWYYPATPGGYFQLNQDIAMILFQIDPPPGWTGTHTFATPAGYRSQSDWQDDIACCVDVPQRGVQDISSIYGNAARQQRELRHQQGIYP